MITIQISNESGQKVSFSLSVESLSMISRFLYYISFANHDLYDNSSNLQNVVGEFYDTDYDPTQLRDAKFLNYMLDLFTEKLY